MNELTQQFERLAGSHGYHIHGTIEFLIGHTLEHVVRDIDVSVKGEDAEKLGQVAKNGSEKQLAQMILNLYMEEDIEEEESSTMVQQVNVTVETMSQE